MPKRHLKLSKQHRLLLRKRQDECLGPVIGFLSLNGISRMDGVCEAIFINFLLSRHEIIFAEGVPIERFFWQKQVTHLVVGRPRGHQCSTWLCNHRQRINAPRATLFNAQTNRGYFETEPQSFRCPLRIACIQIEPVPRFYHKYSLDMWPTWLTEIACFVRIPPKPRRPQTALPRTCRADTSPLRLRSCACGATVFAVPPDTGFDRLFHDIRCNEGTSLR